MQVGFVCSVCLSIFADQKFAICPMCDSKIAGPAGKFQKFQNSKFPEISRKFAICPMFDSKIAGPAGTFDKGAERAKERRERERAN
jgi:hypothetical protein